MIPEIISAALLAIKAGLELANTKASRKYIDLLFEKQKKILEEESRGYEADDTRIEILYKELKIIMDAAAHEIKLATAKS